MLDRECKLYHFSLGYAHSLLRDIDHSAMADQPFPGMNHPAWIIGHLAIVADFALKLLGHPTSCPSEWGPLFGPGSQPTTDRAAYPSKDDLAAALSRGHERLTEAAHQLTTDQMDRPHGVEIAFLKQSLPTLGDLISHILTTHEALHLGQLSAWRRAKGLQGVLQL